IRRRHKDIISPHCVYYELSLQLSLSGNKSIDGFVKETFTAPGASNRYKRLEYVPYEQFTNIKYLSKGGFSKIYKATWKEGPTTSWYSKKQRFHRHRSCTVVLKSLNDSILVRKIKYFKKYNKWT
ncbi:32625_t:CDS:1, partial [Racocetra persica]